MEAFEGIDDVDDDHTVSRYAVSRVTLDTQPRT